MKINALSITIGNHTFSMEDYSSSHSPWHLEGRSHKLSNDDLKGIQKIMEKLPEIEKNIKELLKDVD